MALIIRIDVDRPYGKRPFLRHVLSRLSSDACLPRIEAFGYLKELKLMLQILNENQARSYVFFRRCTLPSQPVVRLLEQGRHEIGLHLEDSRSFASFAWEKQNLEAACRKKSPSCFETWFRWIQARLSSLCSLRTAEVSAVGAAILNATLFGKPRRADCPACDA